MQEPGSNASNPPPEEFEETRKLRAEWARLREKRGQVTDPDILGVLNSRIQEIEASLSKSTPAAPADPASDPDQRTRPAIAAPQPERPPEAEETEEIRKLRAELAKLKENLAQTKDRNIISVLQMRIAQIEPSLPPPPKSERQTQKPKREDDDEDDQALANLQPPTPAEAEEAEKLIRQSMLERRRNNAATASDLLKKAAEVAPGSPVVLEALADDYLARRLTKQARKTYRRALALDPKNVGLERKYAESVLRGTTTMSVEEQLRLGMSDSLFITGADNVAGLNAAKFLSVFFPGVGQLVIGRAQKGVVLFVLWVLCVGLFALWNKDFELLAKMARGIGPGPNWRVLIPIIGMAIIWIVAMLDLTGGETKAAVRSAKVDRPKPPVDLPFE